MSRFNSNRPQESGRMAVYKDDFNAHVHGTAFRHTADLVDMNPVIPSLGESNVQTTLEKLTSLITSAGSGFISVGNAGADGYALGSYNINTDATPTLRDALLAAFEDERVSNGGVILILAGTYVLTSPVDVPAGMTIMGEFEGTNIIGEMTEQSMFNIKKGTKDVRIGGDSGLGPIAADIGTNLNAVHFFNISLFDNLNGTAAGGDASMLTVPMISCDKSSIFVCDQVKFIGRVNNGSVSGRAKSLKAIGYTGSGTTGSLLSLTNCYFDGFKTVATFNPGNGDLDTLEVKNCRARTFGTESFDTSAANNCFISMSRCNALLSNNYHIGASSTSPTVNACFVVTSATGGSNTKIVVTGNTGGPNSSGIFGSRVFYDNSGSNINTVRSGNNWGGSINNEWFVVIGNSAPTALAPPGDFVGSGAIDQLLATAGNGPTTVIVNPGTYIITSNSSVVGNTTFNFIGNVKGSIENYPTFELRLGSSITDPVGRRTFFVGPKLKSIRFKCLTTGTSNFHSVQAACMSDGSEGFPRGEVNIEDCEFHNCGLITPVITPGTTDSTTDKTHINIKSCNFSQDGTFANNLSCLLPPAHTVLLENCIFRGYGYALGIGDETGFTSGTILSNTITLRNCIMDLTGSTITTSPPGSLPASYVWLRSSGSRVNIENCQIVVDNTNTPRTTVIGAGLASTFSSFINILARDVMIDKCLIGGPQQTFTPLATSYALPTVKIEPGHSCRLTRNRFVNGGLPVQVTGSTAFSSSSLRDSLIVKDNQFLTESTATTVTTALLDVDVDISDFGVSAPSQIVVKDNTFRISTSTSFAPVRHTEQTDSFDSLGIVQIYAPLFDVTVSGNRIGGTLQDTTGGAFNHFAGLVINNWNAVSTTDGLRVHSASVYDNFIEVVNSTTALASTSSASSVWIRANIINFKNNYLSINNSPGAEPHFIGNLVLDVRPTSSNSYSDSVISGNIFSRRSNSGATSILSRGYIQISSTSNRGMIVDNSFSDPTYDGSTTALVENLSTTPWLIHNNKNQEEILTLSTGTGVFQIEEVATSDLYLSGNNTDTNSLITTVNGFSFKYLYDNAGNEDRFDWQIDLHSLLPYGVKIVKIEATWDFTTLPATTKTVFIRLNYDGGSEVDSLTAVTTNAFTRSLGISGTSSTTTMSSDHYNMTDVGALFAQIEARINHSGTTTLGVSDVKITYRW